MHRDPDDRLVLRLFMGFVAFIALATLATSAFAADYQCRETLGCTAQISENGQLRTVNFRKGDIVCTEDGWIVSTEDGWKKLKPKRHTPQTVLGSSMQGGFYTDAQARGPFTLYQGQGLVRHWDGTVALATGLVASGYDTPLSGSWRPIGPATSKR